MGAGASSAVLVMRDAVQVTCANAAFDGLQDIASSPKPCSCKSCKRERARASGSPAMDMHDAYTLTTAMRCEKFQRWSACFPFQLVLRAFLTIKK